ncbi:hypothetical protein M9458_045692, partial [Cirrhinus mrigala]
QDEHGIVPELSESRASRARDSIHGTVTCFNFRSNHKTQKQSKTAQTAKENPADCRQKGKNTGRKASQEQKPVAGSSTVGCQWFPWQNTASRNISKGPEHHITEPIFCQNQPYVNSPHNSFCSQTACEETEGAGDISVFTDSWRTDGENAASTPESPNRT